MVRFIAVALFASLFASPCGATFPWLAQASVTAAPVTQIPGTPVPAAPIVPPPATAPDSDRSPAEAPVALPALPPPPPGKSTVLGGEINKVDPVRDMLTLKIVGARPVKILFDQRTQVFLDGKKIPLIDLKAAQHAAVQTVLDGANVYALSIHMLSHSPEGDYQGTVLSYNSMTTELTVTSDISHAAMLLQVPSGTPIVRQGQAAFRMRQNGVGDLVRGALIAVKFAANQTGGAVASQISILAVPGSEFTYDGNIITLDLHAGKLAIQDPRDSRNYQLLFNPAGLQSAQTLRVGEHVIATAVFDGANYVVRSFTPD